MVQTVKEFVDDAYQLISASSPTVPLKGGDLTKGIQFLNELISSFSGTGLMITVAKEVTTNVDTSGGGIVTFAASGAIVNEGRLANIANAWLVLTGVTYPLIAISDHSFFEQYKYEPLLGLPIYAIIYDGIDNTTLQLYPAPSQQYELHVYGKFELAPYTSTSSMNNLPSYFIRYLRLALAKDLSSYKGRENAWTDKLQRDFINAQDDMQSLSNMNLNITDPLGNQLNGAYRVRAGV